MTLVHVLRRKVQEYCGESILDEACLLELGWYMKEVIVTYVEYERYGNKDCHMEENKGQEVIKDRQR